MALGEGKESHYWFGHCRGREIVGKPCKLVPIAHCPNFSRYSQVEPEGRATEVAVGSYTLSSVPRLGNRAGTSWSNNLFLNPS